MQTKKEDKNWQIQRMADIYKKCSTCLVLPGGIGGLVEEGDVTSWLQRSWTLQEALLPRDLKCIFKWTRGPGLMNGGIISFPFDIHENYAALPLDLLIQIGYSGQISFAPHPNPFADDAIATEWDAVLFSTLFSESRHAPLTLNNALMKHDKDETESTIWRCAVKRTSTRDIDEVFSIMGLFGIQLDPSQYTTRSEALLSLLQRSMANGDRANWLATTLSSSSIIPHFSTSGRAPLSSITSLDGNSKESSMEEPVWYLSGAPTGSLDAAGALKTVVPFSQVGINQVVKSRNNALGFEFDAILEVHGASRSAGIFFSGETGTHAAKLGTIVLYSTTAVARFLYLEDTLVMLLDHVAGKWCKKGMAAVPSELTNGWEEQEVIIVGKD